MQKLACIITFLLISVSLSAMEHPDRYSVSLVGLYGWNETWKGYAGADIVGYMPFCKHFEAIAAVEGSGPGIFSMSATARPKYQFTVGELFADGSVHYRNLAVYGISELNFALSAGYRMDYVSVQLGVTSHLSFDRDRETRSDQIRVIEPLNLLYRLAFNVRPASSRWNAGAGVANYTDFEYGRTFGPLYFLHGHYDINDNISVLLRGELKPSGVFHMSAQFWGISFRTGVCYSF